MKLLAIIAIAVAFSVGSAKAEGVGFRDILVEADGEKLRTALWYPTEAAGGRTTVGPFTMNATRDASPGTGPYGLVLISHGTGGGRLNHRETAIRLAEGGYVVAAPEHAGDSWRDGTYSGTAENWRRRPRQLGAVLDRLIGDAELGSRIDPARIGAVGHSAGGYSVLALIGGRADTALLARHCTSHRDEDPQFCAYGRPGGNDGAPIPDLGDRRVRAVVAVAPVGALFGKALSQGWRCPRKSIASPKRVLREPWHAANIALARAFGDFAFITPFPALDGVGAPARDPAGFDRRAFLTPSVEVRRRSIASPKTGSCASRGMRQTSRRCWAIARA